MGSAPCASNALTATARFISLALCSGVLANGPSTGTSSSSTHIPILWTSLRPFTRLLPTTSWRSVSSLGGLWPSSWTKYRRVSNIMWLAASPAGDLFPYLARTSKPASTKTLTDSRQPPMMATCSGRQRYLSMISMSRSPRGGSLAARMAFSGCGWPRPATPCRDVSRYPFTGRSMGSSGWLQRATSRSTHTVS